MNIEQYAAKAREDAKLLETQREMNKRDRAKRAEENLVDEAKMSFYKHPIANGEMLPRDAVEWVLLNVQKTNAVTWDDANDRFEEDIENEAVVSVWLEAKTHKHFLHVMQKQIVVVDVEGPDDPDSAEANVKTEKKWITLGVYQPGEKVESNIVQMNALSAVNRTKIEQLSDIV